MGSARCWLATGAVMGGLSVVLGAFAAHGLDAYFAEKYAGQVRETAGQELSAAAKYLNDFKTGTQYQMYHALALLAVGMLAAGRPQLALHLAGWCFLLGTILFSGSLYVLTTTGQRWWGQIAPFGGTLWIVGWLILAVAAARSKPWQRSQSPLLPGEGLSTPATTNPLPEH